MTMRILNVRDIESFNYIKLHIIDSANPTVLVQCFDFLRVRLDKKQYKLPVSGLIGELLRCCISCQLRKGAITQSAIIPV